MGIYPWKTCTNLVLFSNTNMHTQNPKNLKSRLISRQKQTKKILFLLMQCSIGPMLSSAFWNANNHLSEIFYFNISESQTCSKYYHCQANSPNLSPWYIPPSASVQTCDPM